MRVCRLTKVPTALSGQSAVRGWNWARKPRNGGLLQRKVREVRKVPKPL